eukprot:516123-Hanusia_phi.AAC.3
MQLMTGPGESREAGKQASARVREQGRESRAWSEQRRESMKAVGSSRLPALRRGQSWVAWRRVGANGMIQGEPSQEQGRFEASRRRVGKCFGDKQAGSVA